MTTLVTARGTLGTATFSPCGTYRYHLTRGVPAARRLVAFVMLNPSTADADENDKTLGQCLKFAERSARERRWATHSLAVVNLYGLQSTCPAALRRATDPIGPDNDRVMLETCRKADLVICGWGQHGRRGTDVRSVLQRQRIRLFHLGPLNRGGTPKHPSRLADATPLQEWVSVR